MRDLEEVEKRELLGLSRLTLNQCIWHGCRPVWVPQRDVLKEKAGAFVTLTEEKELRGCIGSISAAAALYQTVIDCTIAAALDDPRFTPVRGEELEKIQIEISVLSPLRAIADLSEIQIGLHGLVVSEGKARGLLLPQVAVQHRWDLATFLGHTCLKAGLREKAWQEGARIETFTAQIFGETLG